MYDGRNLVDDIEGPTDTIYAINVAEWLWRNGELGEFLIQDHGAPDRSKSTTRRPFNSPNDLEKIRLLKGIHI